MTMKDVSSDKTADSPVVLRAAGGSCRGGDESVDRMTLPEAVALLVGDDDNLQAQAARKVASIAASIRPRWRRWFLNSWLRSAAGKTSTSIARWCKPWKQSWWEHQAVQRSN